MTDARFSRTGMLLGAKAMERLAAAHVVVIGLGAVGGYAVEGLARGGVGRLTLVDHDVVQASNINRQLYALESTLGRPKTLVAAERVADINPSCRVEPLELFAHEDTLDRILQGAPDLVIDAIDALLPKRLLIRESVRRGIPIVSSMGAALRLDPTAVRVGPLGRTQGCPLAKRLRRALRSDIDVNQVVCVYSAEPVRLGVEPACDDLCEAIVERGRQRRALPSLPTVTGIFGLTAANEGLRLLLEEWWPGKQERH